MKEKVRLGAVCQFGTRDAGRAAGGSESPAQGPAAAGRETAGSSHSISGVRLRAWAASLPEGMGSQAGRGGAQLLTSGGSSAGPSLASGSSAEQRSGAAWQGLEHSRPLPSREPLEQ